MSIERLVQKVRENDVVLWAGAGYSLYAGMPSVLKLMEKIKEECNEEEKIHLNRISSLSELSSDFVNMRNGSKNELYRILRQEYNINPQTKWVHELLLEIPQITTIITTNYDKLFEEVYGINMDVVITNEQIPLVVKRNVLYKIHGDIDLPKSIVVTNEDYTDFFRSQDTPVWSKIKSLFAEKTMVFVGYSLADQNISYLYDNVMQALDGFQKESFLVAPNLPEFLINKLKRKKITYINLSGEAFTEYLHSEIFKKLLVDIDNGTIESRVGLGILERHKLLPKFESTSKGLKLHSVGTSDENSKMNLNVKFKEFNFIEKLRQSPFEEFEIASDNIISMDSHYKGIEMPSHGSPIKMKVIPKPIIEKCVDLYFKGTDSKILGAKAEMYVGYENDFLIRISNGQLTFELNLDESKFSYSLSDKFESITEVKDVFLFLNYLVSGEGLTVYLKDEQKEVENIIEFNKDENLEQQGEIQTQLELIDKLIDIQRYYQIMFRDFDFSIDETMFQTINVIYADLKNDKYKLDAFYGIIKTNIDGEDSIKEIIKEEKKFRFTFEKELKEIQLFNQLILINKPLHVTCEDAFVVHYDRVEKSIGDEVEYHVTLNSNGNGFDMFLGPLKEVTDC